MGNIPIAGTLIPWEYYLSILSTIARYQDKIEINMYYIHEEITEQGI